MRGGHVSKNQGNGCIDGTSATHKVSGRYKHTHIYIYIYIHIIYIYIHGQIYSNLKHITSALHNLSNVRYIYIYNLSLLAAPNLSLAIPTFCCCPSFFFQYELHIHTPTKNSLTKFFGSTFFSPQPPTLGTTPEAASSVSCPRVLAVSWSR